MGDLEECYKLNVTLLSILGLWPGETTILRRMHRAGCGMIVTVSLIVQLLPFLTMDHTTSFVLHNIPTIIVVMGSVLKYFTFVIQSNDVKEIMELIKHDWSITKDDEESKIFMRRADAGRSYTLAVTKVVYPSVTIVLLSQYAPTFLDLVAPLNETRKLQFLITVELFIDQQKYFHILALGFDLASFTLSTVFLATEAVHMMWLQHQASQFEIYVYRVRKALIGDPVEMHILDKNASIIKIFASALAMHDRAILLSLYLKKLWWSYFILLVFGVTSLSVVLYRLSEAIATMNSLDELMLCLVIILGEFGYMYFINYMKQVVIDSYDNICVAVYDTNWYAAPVRTQKMLLSVILRNMQALNGKMYGMYNPSMEGFMVLAKVTLSYFTMILSMQ